MSEFVSNITDFAPGLRTLHVPDIECTLQPIGREYIVGDRTVTPATDVLLGQMEVMQVEEGLVLYRTTAKDLCTMRTSNLLYPGLKIVLLLEGESELAYGELRLRLRAAYLRSAPPWWHWPVRSASCASGAKAGASASWCSRSAPNGCRPQASHKARCRTSWGATWRTWHITDCP